MKNNSYDSVLKRRGEIMLSSVGIDYNKYEFKNIGFDYEALMNDNNYNLKSIAAIQEAGGVGKTPLKELKNITKLVRKISKPGFGARIFIKDEALNDSGSFKARRASVSVYEAKQKGYKGIISATSGNFGAAVASQAAKCGLKAVIVQECFDSKGIGQPEIIEKARACEAYGAEVIQLSVGPELFYKFLLLLEETGYFNASLYTPYSILGIETLGYELLDDCIRATGKKPDAVICTHAGGGNLTGTARGIKKHNVENIEIIGASVNLTGLHMASDNDFNKKSFTTGHTGFGVPFMTNPDRSDVPRSAARPLRYMDRYYTVRQGEVFYITEALTALEGIERGPAGNTSLAAAFSIAQTMKEDQIIIVQETEYTGAGKHHQAQLSFARSQGINIKFGDPKNEIPGTDIILPEHPALIKAEELDLAYYRGRLIENQVKNEKIITKEDMAYLQAETNTDSTFVIKTLKNLGINIS